MKQSAFFLMAFASMSLAETVTREQLSELHQIRTAIKTAVFDQARYEQDIIKSKLDIENQNHEISENESETAGIKEKILDRVAILYKIRRAYPQGSLLAFAKQEDFLRKNYYLKYLNSQDRKLVFEFQTKTASTSKMKEKVSAYMRRLQLLQKRNENRFAELKVKEARQRELIRKIKEEVNSQDPNRDRDNEAKRFFSEFRGQLPNPVQGEIRGQLGLSRNSKTKLTNLKTGLNVYSPEGSEVKSIFEGEVLYSENILGWGNTIIVDHGESYYSVYGRLKNLSVRLGDKVIAQQKLAEVAGVPYHNSDSDQGLYFEIRHYSEPEDPRMWLKGEPQ
jgi:murein hydrolase activator